MDVAQEIQNKINATKDLASLEEIERMRVLWRKGRNMFQSFFTEAETIRRRVSDDKLFATWCFYQLQIGITAITNMTQALMEDDAARVRNEFSAVKKAEQDRKAEEVHQRKLDKIKKNNELSAERAKNAERVAAEKAAEAKRKADAKRETNRERRRLRAEIEGANLERAKRAWLETPNATREEIAKRADVSSGQATSARKILEGAGKLDPKEKADPMSLYDQAVEVCKKFAGHQWVIGDWAIRVSAEAKYGKGTLSQFATDIGVELATLEKYRWTAEAYPDPAKLGRPNYSVCEILAKNPARFIILTDKPHISCEEAREIMRAYRAETNIIPMRKDQDARAERTRRVT